MLTDNRKRRSALPRQYTLASTILILTIAFVSLSIFNGLALDLLRLPINAWVVLAATLIEIAATIAFLWRHGALSFHPAYEELFPFLILVGITAAYLIYPSLPNLTPPSHHFDAANHIVLANFIFEHDTLPHEASWQINPFFMNGYPAGGALFDALVSHWTGSTPFGTLHIVISIILGLTAGLVFLVLKRLLPDEPLSTPIAFLSTTLLFTAWDYFPGTVNERYYYAQVISQFFAICTFWFACSYLILPDLFYIALMSMTVSMTLVTHPTAIIGASLIAIGAVALRQGTPSRSKGIHAVVLGIGLLPVLLVYVIFHLKDWTALTGYGEAAVLSPQSIGFILPTLGIAGALFALTRWRNRFWPTFLFIAAALAQPLFLLVVQIFIPVYLPNFLNRSIYLLIYPLALLSSLPLLALARRVAPRLHFQVSRVAWGAVALVSCSVLVVLPPRPFSPITSDEVKLAYWARQNIDVDNIGVISPVREDAYWIQWAIFLHPPSTFTVINAYTMGSMAYQEWRENPGRPDYAITRNSAGTRQDAGVQVIRESGRSAILLKQPSQIPQAPTPQHQTELQVGDLFRLVGYDAPDTLSTHSPLTFTFYWKPLSWNSDRVSMFIQILDSAGNVITRSEKAMFNDRFPTQHWPIGPVIPDKWTLKLDPDILPGEYTAEVAVLDEGGSRQHVRASNGEAADAITLGPYRLIVPPPSEEELRRAHTVYAQFGNGIRLAAYSVSASVVRGGETVRIILYWDAQTPADRDYTVFVHLLNLSGQVIAQRDSPPQNGTYPTNLWHPGETIADPYSIVVPPGTAPGEYQIELGLYTPSDLKRVPVDGSDRIILPESVTVK